MEGIIVKAIAGFFYVDTPQGRLECKAKGVLRQGERPLVGDRVRLAPLEGQPGKGNIEAVCARRNVLTRPQVANVDQVLLWFALADPQPQFALLDKLLAAVERLGLPILLGFNKRDLISGEQEALCRALYGPAGYELFFCSAAQGELGDLPQRLSGHINALAGPSGAGKSSLANALLGEAAMETGRVSARTGLGRHTTRHAQLLPLVQGGYILDTPGFGAMELPSMEARELGGAFPEIGRLEAGCRFRGCLHLGEPDCAVKAALARGEIPEQRYAHYVKFQEELARGRRFS